MNNPANVTVVGLGYVGLPLALAFARELPTTGFDVFDARVDELLAGSDRNREVPDAEIAASSVTFTADASCITDAEFIVVTVPTPVNEDHSPDLSLLESASAMIGVQLRRRSAGLPAPVIVYESTTYPGCTEDFCGPIIERESGLKSGTGFFLGYSPERTNFGDAEHNLETVVKVVSGQTPEVAQVVRNTYGLIAKAGTHLAANIKTAEASKVIENVQRDLNIALFNELAMIFDRMDIKSSDVFDAAATKWNFHRYQPGLVGGHCIPVDPYYLTHAAAEAGYDAKIVLAGRDVNEMMPEFIAAKILRYLDGRSSESDEASVLILGQTFKADIADTRNSKAITLAALIAARGVSTKVSDPMISGGSKEDGHLDVVDDPFKSSERFDVVVLAVPHSLFLSQLDQIVRLLWSGGLLVDVVGAMDGDRVLNQDYIYWSP